MLKTLRSFRDLGANEKDIFNDYLLTNKSKIDYDEYPLSRMKSAGLSANDAELFYTKIMSVDESYLQGTYCAAVKENGDFLTHIIKYLSITDEEIEQLRFLCTQ